MAQTVVGNLNFRIGATTGAMGRGFAQAETQLRGFAARIGKFLRPKGSGIASVFAIPHPVILGLRTVSRIFREIAQSTRQFLRWMRQLDTAKLFAAGKITQPEAAGIRFGQMAMERLASAFEHLGLKIAAELGPILDVLVTRFTEFSGILEATIKDLPVAVGALMEMADFIPGVETSALQFFKELAESRRRMKALGPGLGLSPRPDESRARSEGLQGVAAVTRGTTEAFSARHAAQREQVERDQLRVLRRIQQAAEKMAEEKKPMLGIVPL